MNRNRITLLIASVLLAAPWWAGPARGESITIVTGEDARPPVKFAAAELVSYLGRIYPEDQFVPASRPAPAGRSVVLALNGSKTARTHGISAASPGGYRIKHLPAAGGGGHLLVVADRPEAMPHAAYGLLGKLGCAFGFGEEAVPGPLPEGGPDFAACEAADVPLSRDRYIFNWHNFLSTCTGWSKEDWVEWIGDGSKTGYNAIMTHCYPNNPMIPGSFEGVERPVGFIATTRQGRDWSVPHVNDVRRLPGGEVFDHPVFGSREVVALEGRPAGEQAVAVRKMMRRAFEEAKRRGMKVHMTIDCDLARANPQQMIRKLPATARFKVPYKGVGWLMDPAGDLWLVRPDTPEGYAYIKEQARQLLEAYPQIDEINFWRRAYGSLTTQLKRAHLPADWHADFDRKLATLPALPKGMHDNHAWNFLLAKRIAAWKQACKELGRLDIGFATGSWRPHWIASAAWWLAPETRLVMLDSEIRRGPKDSLRHNQALAEQIGKLVQPPGRFVPIIWSHHDDGEYVGAHLEPYPKLVDSLASWNSDSFGVIHWLPQLHTRHLQHHGRQVWQGTKNEPYVETVRWWNERRYPGKIAGQVVELEMDRLKTLPAFGRETTQHFIDRPLAKYLHRYDGLTADKVIAASKRRRKAFAQLATTPNLPKSAREALAYQGFYEEFCGSLWTAQQQAEEIATAVKTGDRPRAVELARSLDAHVPLKAYGCMLDNGLESQSARGLFVSMALRWWPDVEDLRQKLGVQASSFQFAPTRHESLAFMRGDKTWWVDRETHLWRVLGETETGAKVFTRRQAPVHRNASYAEIGRHGLVSDQALNLKLGSLHGKPLASGRYRLTLLVARPDAVTGPVRFTARAETYSPKSKEGTDGFQLVAGTTQFDDKVLPDEIRQNKQADKDVNAKAAKPRLEVLDRSISLADDPNELQLIEAEINLPYAAKLELILTPEAGPVVISGVRIAPVGKGRP